MPVKFDAQTLERFRTMTPHEIYREVTSAVHQVEGPKGSEDFVDALDSLVDEGILSWDQIQNFESDEDN
jgi:hypothetical protein